MTPHPTKNKPTTWKTNSTAKINSTPLHYYDVCGGQRKTCQVYFHPVTENKHSPPPVLKWDKERRKETRYLWQSIHKHLKENTGLTVHEFKQFIDDCLQEPPVGAKEAGVLPNDVHDVGGDDGLVVFASLLFAQSQQVLFEGKGTQETMKWQNTNAWLHKTDHIYKTLPILSEYWRPHWYKYCHIFVYCTLADSIINGEGAQALLGSSRKEWVLLLLTVSMTSEDDIQHNKHHTH